MHQAPRESLPRNCCGEGPEPIIRGSISSISPQSVGPRVAGSHKGGHRVLLAECKASKYLTCCRDKPGFCQILRQVYGTGHRQETMKLCEGDECGDVENIMVGFAYWQCRGCEELVVRRFSS